MPSPSSSFSKWIAQDFPSNAQLVECLSITFEATNTIFNITNYGVPFEATNENGGLINYLPVPFTVSNQKVGATTEQKLSVTLDGLNGALYSVIKDLTPLQRQSLVTVIHRIYLDTDVTAPVITPPSSYFLDTVKATLTEVQMVLIGTRLPQRRAGQTYSSNQFPMLFYL